MPAAATPTPAELLAAVAAAPGDPRPVPRVLLLAAHPDDEVIGVGTRLPRLVPQLTIAHVTDGSPKNDADARVNGFANGPAYAAARRRELSEALRLVGFTGRQLIELNVGDQEASTQLYELTQKVAGLLRSVRPQVLLTHPYEGGHPDHDATAFAAQAAVRLLRREGVAIARVEMTSYHNGPGGITTGVFLPDADSQAVSEPLDDGQQSFKRRLFDCFVTQRQTLSYFRTDVEAYRLAPAYDFTEPPHAGTLFYDQFDWGMTGVGFRALAADALRMLGLAAGS